MYECLYLDINTISIIKKQMITNITITFHNLGKKEHRNFWITTTIGSFANECHHHQLRWWQKDYCCCYSKTLPPLAGLVSMLFLDLSISFFIYPCSHKGISIRYVDFFNGY